MSQDSNNVLQNAALLRGYNRGDSVVNNANYPDYGTQNQTNQRTEPPRQDSQMYKLFCTPLNLFMFIGAVVIIAVIAILLVVYK
jgi:hypothetical protein